MLDGIPHDPAAWLESQEYAQARRVVLEMHRTQQFNPLETSLPTGEERVLLAELERRATEANVCFRLGYNSTQGRYGVLAVLEGYVRPAGGGIARRADGPDEWECPPARPAGIVLLGAYQELPPPLKEAGLNVAFAEHAVLLRKQAERLCTTEAEMIGEELEILQESYVAAVYELQEEYEG